MTIEQYLRQSLEAFGLNEAFMADLLIDAGLDLNEPYEASVQEKVGRAMASAVEKLIFMPRQTSVSENGFSLSWDYANIGKYYLWLCRRWGITPNKETVGALGIPTIIDRTSSW